MSVDAAAREALPARAVKAFGPRGLIAWGLLLACVFSMVSAMVTSVKGLDLAFLSSVALLAATVGWAFGLFRTRAWSALLFGLLFGAEYLLVRVGHLWTAIWDTVRAAVQFAWELLVWAYYWDRLPQWDRVPEQATALWSAMLLLISRAYEWLSLILAGTARVDPVGTALIWGFGVWVCAYWAGWYVRRHNQPLVAILPGGALTAFVLSYTNSSPYLLLPLVGTTLVLMAIVQQRDRESRWSVSGIDFSQALWTDVAAVATGVALALVLAAALSPSLTFYKIADWVEELTQGEDEGRAEIVAESLGLEQKPDYRPPTPL